MLATTLSPAPHMTRQSSSLICADVVITGSVHAKGDLRVDCRIEGNVSGQNLVIGDTAEIYGEVQAATVVVRGKVDGSIIAKKVTLATGCQMRGQIAYQSLEVELGAIIESKICRYVDSTARLLPARSD